MAANRRYKLSYFPVRARAEPIRIILSLAGVDWEDNRNLGGKDITALNEEGIPPFGQLPILEFDDVILAQSMAILRFLSREHGFVPESSLEIAIADSIVDQIQDCVLEAVKPCYIKDPKEVEKMEQDLNDNYYPPNLSYFEKIFQKNCKGKTYFFGEKVTYADINFFCFVNGFILSGQLEVPPMLANYPGLTKTYTAMLNEPKLQNYLKNRPKSKRNKSPEKEKVKQDLNDNYLPKNLSYFEKIFQKNCKGKTYFFGEKVTYADINFFCFVNGFILSGQLEVPPILANYPGLTKTYTAMLNEPKLQNYLKNRPKTDGR
ncbi:glutathione S-transferase P 1-like [Xenia sp. Carnegie-2017]|uniref:glutathione S-transferase P 1-like n=1 Tax=Xenia sp. Carnegie-2017 TaxID=2897299 RepID=UPI001F04B660|nr:glutathione S-transferase P 1-like [Xenia sp. Carnegie-2017]